MTNRGMNFLCLAAAIPVALVALLAGASFLLQALGE